jgi:hypothetical protein
VWLAVPATAHQPPASGQAGPPTQARHDDSRPASLSFGADRTLTITPGAPPLRLRAVLDAISAHARTPIAVSELLDREEVTMSLHALPLEEALKRLLAPYDVFYLYSGTGRKPAGAIAALWVYRRGEGQTLEPVPPELWASTKELESQLDDPDPGIRSETYEALIERQGARALATVLRGLTDADESVRLMTISTAASEGVDIPTTDLEAVLFADRSYAVRRLALEALNGRSEAAEIARRLVEDPDEHIRQEAAAMLEHLESPTPAPRRP